MSNGSSDVRPARFTVVAVVVALALTGCGSAKPTSSTTSTSVTSTTLSTADAAILDSYRQFQADYLAVGSTMNLADPRLTAHATGAELQKLRTTFAGLKLDGDAIAGNITVDPSLVSHNDETASVRDCSIDASRTIKVATGATVGDGSTASELTLVTLQNDGGVWKVAAIQHEGSGCAQGQ